MENYYRILRVSHNANPGAIHDAYRALSRQVRLEGEGSTAAAALLQRIEEAYAVLADAGRRRTYDVEFARQDEASRADERFCNECLSLARKLYPRRQPPCEWCDRLASLCAPSREGLSSAEPSHVWLCTRCFYEMYRG